MYIFNTISGCLLKACVLALSVSGIVDAVLVSKGFSVTLNDIDYYVSPYSVGNVTVDVARLGTASSVHGFYPVTVVQESIAVSELPALVKNYTEVDDVFQTTFLQAVFMSDAPTNQSVAPEGMAFSVFSLDSGTIPSGPYFLEASTSSLYPVYRLYADTVGAFTQGLLQTPSGTFQSLSAQVDSSADLTIGVPSRLYYTPTAEKPLAGVRIGIKDIYDLAGVKKSNGNRAWFNLYPAANTTAVSVQRLIDAGAIVVGHQKTSQFANGERATADWVDYHSPFNPRGDGYQDPSSSSAGAGASIAAYSWLDIALGSDTGGSIRGPAGVQGLFGNRPSFGLVSLDGVMPLAPELDTPGFEVRDPYLWDVANKAMYGDNYTSYNENVTISPSQIYTLSFPTNASSSATAALYVNFLRNLTSIFSSQATPLNLTAAWQSTGPQNTTSSLNTFLNTTYPTLIATQQIRLVRNPFYADYAALHDGRLPFVDPAPLIRWAYADSLPNMTTAEQEAITNKTIFMNWFNTNILPLPSSSSCASAPIILYPSTSSPGSSPRSTYFAAPTVPFGFSSSRISVFAEVPDFVFPIGQSSVLSNITAHQEFYPVTVDVMAPVGCDGLLVALAQKLVKEGIVIVPEVGGTVFGGEILNKRAERVRYIG